GWSDSGRGIARFEKPSLDLREPARADPGRGGSLGLPAERDGDGARSTPTPVASPAGAGRAGVHQRLSGSREAARPALVFELLARSHHGRGEIRLSSRRVSGEREAAA